MIDSLLRFSLSSLPLSEPAMRANSLVGLGCVDIISRRSKNLVYGLALNEFSIAQWIERPPGVWEVIGSNPVGDSDFFFAPRS